jgi:hypothetical protein
MCPFSGYGYNMTFNKRLSFSKLFYKKNNIINRYKGTPMLQVTNLQQSRIQT